MKALIRNPGETVTEADGIKGIYWNTGAPLTNAAWYGGPYQLVENYIEVEDGAIYDVAVDPEPKEEIVPDGVEVNIDDIVMINGVAYTKEQLRQMLGE